MKKGLGFKILIIILVLLLAGVVFQLVETFSLHTMNVHTQIKATPPGIARIIEGNEESFGSAPILEGTENSPSFNPTTGGSQETPGTIPPTGGDEEPPSTTTPPDGKDKPPAAAPPAGGGGGGAPSGLQFKVTQNPTILTINTDIDFGTAFPGEERQGHFIVYLTGTSNSTDEDPWDNPFAQVTYNVTLLAPPDAAYKDMRPYLLVQRNPAESDVEPDATANGTDGDYYAFGHLDENVGDTSDEWLVTLYTPDETGNYWIEIEIGAPYEGPLP